MSRTTKIKAAGYVAYNDHAIFGVGTTEDEALEDAEEWLDGSDPSGLTVSPATAALMRLVNDRGGDAPMAFIFGSNGYLRLCCTEAEEAAADADEDAQ